MTNETTSNLSRVTICWLLLVILAPWRLYAQIDTARITGTVTDSTGAVISDAAITLTNENTGVVQTVRSNSTGTYVFEAAPPGTYTMQGQKQGFEQYAAHGVILHVQDNLTINISLVPGSVSQQVTVTDAAPQLQTEDASVGQTVDSRTVNDLPLNGRNWASLAQLAAGVTTPAGAAPGAAIFAVDGLHFGQNDYRLNGIDDNVEVYGGTAFGTNASVTPPPDGIEEFKLQNGDYDAEFGHSAGGVINAVVKSGTNNLHGDLWEYVRNNILDANDYFSNQFNLPIPGYHQNQFGGTVGGPVYIPKLYNGRNKTFFFVDYQDTRIVEAVGVTSTVPTASMQGSSFTNLQDLITDNSGTRSDALGRTFSLGTVLDPATTRAVPANGIDPVTGLENTQKQAVYVRDPFYSGGSIAGIKDFTRLSQYLNHIPAARLDQNAVKLLQLYPQQNGPGLINNFHNNAKETQNVNQVDVRIDHNFSANDILFGVFDQDNINYVTPTNLPGIANGSIDTAGNTNGPHYAVALGYTHVFTPTLTNEIRFGFDHTTENIATFEANTEGIPAQYGIQGIPQLPGNGGLPKIKIGGLSGIGASGYEPTFATMWDLEVSDNVTKLHGNHTFKMGYQIDSIEGDLTQPPNSRGQFNFSGQYSDIPNASSATTGVADLLLLPAQATVPNGIPNVGGLTNFSGTNYAAINDHRYYMGAYFQDDYKVTPSLTINLGLRWDYVTPYAEAAGRQANFVQVGGNGAAGTYYIPQKGCGVTRSATFDALLQSSNIQLDCTSGLTVASSQKDNFAPRLGIAYRMTPKAVIRAGYGLVYGSLEDVGSAPNILGGNYPFLYTISFQGPSSYSPLLLPNGATATMENTFAAYSLQNPAVVSGQGLGLAGSVFNFQSPYVQTYNMTFQYQLASHDSVQIGYVGNVGRHLDSYGTHNSPSEVLPPGTSIYGAIPFPSLSPNSTYISNDSVSSYNSLQSTYERTFAAGLQLLANYTYSKCLSDQELNTGDFNSPPGFRAQWLPGFGIHADYAPCVTDSAHVVHGSGIYQLPFGGGRKWLNGSGKIVDGVAGGWSVNFIYTHQSGEPFTIPCPIATTSDFGCDANILPGQNVYAGPHNQQQWLNPQAFANPPVATATGQADYSVLGGAPQQVRGPGFNNLDFSLFKQFTVYREAYLQFRAEAFNLTNTPQFAQPNANLDFTNTAKFSQITGLVNTPRLLQFALKLIF